MINYDFSEVIFLKKYKILIFDLDDTLIDNQENTKYAYAKMLETYGESYSDEGFKRWTEIDKKFWRDRQDGLIAIPDKFKHETGKKSDEFLNWLRAQRVLIYFNYQIGLEEAVKLNNTFMNELTEVVIPINGAHHLLKYLKEKGYYIIIATNGPQIATKQKLSKINCLNFVDKVFSADMFGYMKPKKEFFESIQKVLNNHKREEYLIVGDSLKSDVEFAMNCNFDSCFFNKNKEKVLSPYKPTYIIEKLEELENIL